jgi:hypothetical protein
MSCGGLLSPCCKGFGRRLQGHCLVERELAFVACSVENRVSLCAIRVPRLSNIDVLPVTIKELWEYILVSLVSPSWLFLPFIIVVLHLYFLITCVYACHLR